MALHIRPLTADFPLAYPFDPAFEQDRYKGTDDAEGKKIGDDVADEKYMADFYRCVETGDFEPVTRAGERPTFFWCRPITGTEKRHIDSAPPALRPQYAFRLALVRVADAGSHLEKIDRAVDAALPQLGKIATIKYVNQLEVLPGLVNILAINILNRSTDLGPP